MPNDRKSTYTTVASFQERDIAWKNAIDSAKKHIQYGGYLQAKGGKLIEGLDEVKTIEDVDRWQKLYDKALMNIEKGIKIEREAQTTLIELYHQQPIGP